MTDVSRDTLVDWMSGALFYRYGSVKRGEYTPHEKWVADAEGILDWLAKNGHPLALPSPAPEPPPQQWDDDFDEAWRRADVLWDKLQECLPPDQAKFLGDGIYSPMLTNLLNLKDVLERAAQPAPDPEAIRLLRELTAFCELGTRDARGYCRWCGYNQPKAKQPHALSCAVGQARFFLSKSEARESGGEP